jgi:type VI protein secretion system component Hcp
MLPSDLTRRHAIRLGAALAAFAVAPGALPAQAAFDSYISFDGSALQGSSPQGFEILSFSWGATQGGTLTGARSGAGGKVRFQDLTITRKVDSASPKLFQACASGQHFPKLRLVSGGRTLVFDDVVIANVRTNGGNAPTETLTFDYGKVEITGQPH